MIMANPNTVNNTVNNVIKTVDGIMYVSVCMYVYVCICMYMYAICKYQINIIN
jgi:hypothetical protein